MRRLLCLWLPNWPIQRVTVARPPLPGSGLVLYQRDGRGQSVAAHCHRAGAQGIRVGMPLTEARALARPHSARSAGQATRFLPYDPSADQRTLAQLGHGCEAFSPIVGLADETPPSSLLLDLTGVSGRWGGERQLVEQILARLAEQGYQARAGVADTLGAAWGLAHSESEMAIQIAAPGETLAALRPLPVTALRLPINTVNLLHELGVERIEQLLQLPRAGLALRLGHELMVRLDQALGHREEPIVTSREPASFVTNWHTEDPTASREVLEQVIQHLSCHLSQLLASQQQGALELCCQLRVSEAAAVHEFSVGLFQPSAQPDHLWQLLRLQLESIQVSGPIASVTLIASVTSSLVAQQIHLWDNMPLLPDSSHDPFGLSSPCRQRGHREFLAQLIERLSSRLGSDAVSGVGLRAARLPEAAYARLPLTGSSGAAAARRRNRDRAPVLSPNLRPLWLIQPPVSLQVTRHTPAGLPQEFTDGTTWQAAADYLGPERIETAWWQGPIVRRDYYRVRCVSGVRLWLFQNLIDQRWFLQGMFD